MPSVAYGSSVVVPMSGAPRGSRPAAGIGVEEEIGDLIFTAVNLARVAGIDPEGALRATNAKFERRFAYVEKAVVSEGRSLQDASLAEMDRHWTDAKTKAAR